MCDKNIGLCVKDKKTSIKRLNEKMRFEHFLKSGEDGADEGKQGRLSYLPLATNAPRTMFGGGFIKSLINFSIQKST